MLKGNRVHIYVFKLTFIKNSGEKTLGTKKQAFAWHWFRSVVTDASNGPFLVSKWIRMHSCWISFSNRYWRHEVYHIHLANGKPSKSHVVNIISASYANDLFRLRPSALDSSRPETTKRWARVNYVNVQEWKSLFSSSRWRLFNWEKAIPNWDCLRTRLESWVIRLPCEKLI